MAICVRVCVCVGVGQCFSYILTKNDLLKNHPDGHKRTLGRSIMVYKGSSVHIFTSFLFPLYRLLAIKLHPFKFESTFCKNIRWHQAQKRPQSQEQRQRQRAIICVCVWVTVSLWVCLCMRGWVLWVWLSLLSCVKVCGSVSEFVCLCLFLCVPCVYLCLPLCVSGAHIKGSDFRVVCMAVTLISFQPSHKI